MKNRRDFFSQVINAKVVLTKFGKIVDEVLNNMPRLYNIEIDSYIIMPDHIHVIIILDESLRDTNNKKQISLSDLVGKFKSYSTREIRALLENKNEFEWQKSFYDRIIRNDKELYNIRNYIQNNPLNWVFEKNNPENLKM